MRLVDRLLAAAPAPPFPNLIQGEPDPAAVAALYAEYRNRIAAAPAVAADAAARWYAEAIRAVPGPPNDLATVPPLTPKVRRAFVEVTAPGVPYPAPWGWLWEFCPGTTVVPILTSRGIDPPPTLAIGLVGQLALVPVASAGDAAWLPARAAVLALDSSGRLCGPPLLGSASGEDDGGHDVTATIDAAVAPLLVAGLFCLAVALCPASKLEKVAPPDPLQKARQRRGRPPLATYHRLDASAVLDPLRHEGLAGIAGLPAAIAACDRLFPGPAQPRSRIVDPSGVPFELPRPR